MAFIQNHKTTLSCGYVKRVYTSKTPKNDLELEKWVWTGYYGTYLKEFLDKFNFLHMAIILNIF